MKTWSTEFCSQIGSWPGADSSSAPGAAAKLSAKPSATSVAPRLSRQALPRLLLLSVRWSSTPRPFYLDLND